MMHILLPHEPYVFAANGEYSGLSELDSKFSPAGFRDQLAFTNDRIRGIVDGLLERAGGDAAHHHHRGGRGALPRPVLQGPERLRLGDRDS